LSGRIAAVLLLLGLGRLSGASEPPVIASVSIDSDGKIDAGEVARLLEIRAGQRLDSDSVRRSIQNLYATGRYAQIAVESENETKGRVDLVVHLFRTFRVASLRFAGNPVSGDELRRSLGYALGGAYQESEVFEGVDRLKRLLATEGYFDARISVSTEFHRESFEAIVTYEIKPGPPTRLSPPVFDGELEPFAAKQLIAELHQKDGQRYREERVKKDAERLQAFLLAKNYLRAEVRLIGVETRGARAAPVFRVEVGPKITFETTGVEEKRVRNDFLGLLKDRVFQEDLLASYVESLRRSYQESGYHAAQVSYSIEPSVGGQRVVLTVVRGERQSVEKIVLEGVHAFPEDKIRNLLLTRSRSLLRRGRLVDPVLDEDRQIVLGFYRSAGFTQVEFPKPEISPGERKGSLVVTLRVHEGPQTITGKIGIEGVERADRQEMSKLLTLSPGKPLNPQNVLDDRQALTGYLHDNGWTTASVEPAVAFSADRSVADVSYRVVEGNREFFGRTIVTGNTRTKTDRLLLPFRFREGEPFSESKLLESQRDLSRTGVFQKVSLERELPDASTPERNIIVRVSEGRPLSLLYGVGYQYEETTGDQSPFGILGIGYNNLFGTLRSLSLESRFAPTTGRGRVFLNFRDPFFFGKDLPLTATVFYAREPIQTIDVRRRGAFLQATRQLTTRVQVGVRYEFQRISTRSNSPLELATIQPFDRDIAESTVGATVLWDRRDDIIDPHRGVFVSAFAKKAFPASVLSADARYVKSYAQASAYLPLLGGVLAGSIRAGKAWVPGGCGAHGAGAASAACVPLAERFFSGGRTSNRGFGFGVQGISEETVDYSVIEVPVKAGLEGKGTCRGIDPEFGANFNCDFGPRVVGGSSTAGINLEWRFPIAGDFGGQIFYDATQVWGDGSFHLSFEGSRGLRQTVGLGIRYLTAVGPLRFEYGRVLHPRTLVVPLSLFDQETMKVVPFEPNPRTVKQKEPSYKLYLSIGYVF
jgi:outer membrane protein insertion porin family